MAQWVYFLSTDFQNRYPPQEDYCVTLNAKHPLILLITVFSPSLHSGRANQRSKGSSSILPRFLNSTTDIHSLHGYRVSILAFPRLARSFLLDGWLTDFHKDHNNTTSEVSCFISVGPLWKMEQLFLFCWIILARWTFYCSKGVECLVLLSWFSLPLSRLLWITSSMVSYVIVRYDSQPLTTSGIHVIVNADFWALCRILRRF